MYFSEKRGPEIVVYTLKGGHWSNCGKLFSFMDLKKICIGVAPLGDVPGPALQSIEAYIRTHLNLRSDILPPLENPNYAYDAKRGQYNAAAILKSLQSMPFQNHDKIIAVVNVDLFIPIFTHVLGEAKEGGKYAVASLYRLSGAPNKLNAPMNRITERLVKVAIHELGHLFSMAHCMNKRCLMHYSGNLRDLDTTSLKFCDYCLEFLSYSIGRGPV